MHDLGLVPKQSALRAVVLHPIELEVDEPVNIEREAESHQQSQEEPRVKVFRGSPIPQEDGEYRDGSRVIRFDQGSDHAKDLGYQRWLPQ